MSFCPQCGAALPEGTKFCPACGSRTADAPARAGTPQPEISDRTSVKRKKPIFKRWWFWALVVLVLASVFSRAGARKTPAAAPMRTEAPAAAPAATEAPLVTAAPAATAAPSPEPTAAAAESSAIRPEVREFLDAYETCMDEYAEFMQKYSKADPNSMVSMMGDYYSILARYTEFSEKLDAFDESQLNSAELAYYLEVTGRVSQKLLAAAGG